MTTQEKIDFIRSKVEEGKVVYYILPDQMAVSTLEELCDQPADGILYDLNRDEASILAFAGDDNPYWVNNLAAAQVIRYLKGRVEELESQKRKVIQSLKNWKEMDSFPVMTGETLKELEDLLKKWTA